MGNNLKAYQNPIKGDKYTVVPSDNNPPLPPPVSEQNESSWNIWRYFRAKVTVILGKLKKNDQA